MKRRNYTYPLIKQLMKKGALLTFSLSLFLFLTPQANGQSCTGFKPPQPVIKTDSICKGGNSTLTTKRSNLPEAEFRWYNSLSSDSVIAKGMTYSKANVQQNDTFYVERQDSVGYPIKITEIDKGIDFVEIQNVTNKQVDASNHTVAVNDSRNQVSSIEDYWPVSGTMSGKGIKVAGDGGSPWNSTNNLPWVSRDAVWCMLIDPNGELVDFVTIGFSLSDFSGFNETINGHTITYSDIQAEWSGSGVTNGNNEVARTGSGDNDDASDWTLPSSDSENSTNPGLTLPFPSGTCTTDRDTAIIEVRPNPTASFTNSGSNLCALDSSIFVETSTFTGNGSLSHQWNIGIGVQLSGDKVGYEFPQSDGTYDVTQVAKSNFGCTDTTSKQVEVNALPVANFRTPEGCTGIDLQFKDSTVFPGSGGLNYSWEIGNQTYTDANPTHVYNSAGSKDVQLTVTSSNGCVDSASGQATVYPTPDAQYSVSNACAEDQVQFTDQTTFSGNASNLNYAWKFGDSDVSNVDGSVQHTYDTIGDYQTNLRVKSDDGCLDTASSSISIYGVPDPDFTYMNKCMERDVAFSNHTLFAGDTADLSYNWDFGSQTSGMREADYQFANAQDYNVDLEVTNDNGNCSRTVSKTVTVKPQPQPAFSLNGTCLDDTTNFTYDGDNPAESYAWKFGGMQGTSQRAYPNFNFKDTGSFDVQLSVSFYNGRCTLDSTRTVAINPVPHASFKFENDALCTGDTMEVMNNSSFAGNNNNLTHEWDYGASGDATGFAPDHVFNNAGTYSVNLSVTSDDGCASSFSRRKLVNASPESDFTHNLSGVGERSFTPTSTAGDNYLWRFGDGATSNNINASHTYDSNGSYDVELKVMSQEGCPSTTTKTVSVGNVGLEKSNAQQNNMEVYPNPFQDVANIQYQLDEQAPVELAIFDANGRKVVGQSYNTLKAGDYSFEFTADSEDAAGSVYFIRLQIGDEVYNKRVVRVQ